jgi:hypothetical protein
MSHSTTVAVPLYRNSAFQPGLDALSAFLAENQYSMHAIDRILAHAAAHGTPTGSPYLDGEDESGANDAFVDGLESVLLDSPGWDDPSVFLDVDSILEAAQGLDDADRSIPAGAVLVPPELDDDLGLPSLSGGAPEGRAEPARFDRHSPEALARINLALYGRSEPFHA